MTRRPKSVLKELQLLQEDFQNSNSCDGGKQGSLGAEAEGKTLEEALPMLDLNTHKQESPR